MDYSNHIFQFTALCFSRRGASAWKHFRHVKGVTCFDPREMRGLGACPVCLFCWLLCVTFSSAFRTLPSGHHWYVKTETFSKPFPLVKAHLAAHKEWVAGLRAQGVIITSGYRVDANDRPGGGGMMFFSAKNWLEAEELVERDPLIVNDCVNFQLNRWIPEVGDIALGDGGTWYDK